MNSTDAVLAVINTLKEYNNNTLTTTEEIAGIFRSLEEEAAIAADRAEDRHAQAKAELDLLISIETKIRAGATPLTSTVVTK